MATIEDAGFKGLVAPAGITMIAAVASGLRMGTLLGLLPRLIEDLATGPLLLLALHIAGAAATVGAIVLHSRLGLLIAVLYTGYSTVVLALGAPSSHLIVLTWAVGLTVLALCLGCAMTAATRARRLPACIASLVSAVAGFFLLLVFR